nr:hypothetical protein [Rhodococcus wratislaviensis]GLK33623.1 hypothetical protein GCM10017611_04650 [Rhodococcus wratislaviensis]
MKSAKEALEILAAYDLTKSYRAAGAAGGVLASHRRPSRRRTRHRRCADPPRDKRAMLIDE